MICAVVVLRYKMRISDKDPKRFHYASHQLNGHNNKEEHRRSHITQSPYGVKNTDRWYHVLVAQNTQNVTMTQTDQGQLVTQLVFHVCEVLTGGGSG